jgi:thiol-disulfide isomerase/thioredoxin
MLHRLAPAPIAVLALSTLLAFASSAAFAPRAIAGGDWNDSAITWKSYDEGLAEAKTANKPVCLVFYTDWCPHCTSYSKVFHDPALVELAKQFVMIRINKDADPATSAKYAPDGEYIPRTFFLSPDGTLMADVTEQRPQYKYFYNENSPEGVTRSMKTVLARK